MSTFWGCWITSDRPFMVIFPSNRTSIYEWCFISCEFKKRTLKKKNTRFYQTLDYVLKTCSPFGRVNMIWVTLISIQYISTRIFTWTNERDVSYVMAMVTKWNPILFYTNRDVPRSGCLFLKSSFNTRLPLLLLLLSWSSTMGPPCKSTAEQPHLHFTIKPASAKDWA